MENGQEKKVSETNVVEAVSFAEAETRFIKEMEEYDAVGLDVTAIKIAPYSEIFFNDEDDSADRWYKVTLDFITLNERTNSERREKDVYLFQAGSFDEAKKSVVEEMKKSVIDYEIVKIEETKLWFVFEH